MLQTDKSISRARRSQYREACIWLLLAAAVWPVHTAHAYVDPGTGSFIVQILIGLFFGAAYTVRRFWSTITGWFKKKSAISPRSNGSTSGEKKTDNQ